MKCKKPSHLFIVLFLTMSYCMTFPLLAVMHTHNVTNGTRSASVQAAKSEISVTDNPLFCAVCFRLNSTQTVFPQECILPAVHPGYEIILQDPGTRPPSDHYFYSQTRAPPPVNTFC